jgi:hypothetical protein
LIRKRRRDRNSCTLRDDAIGERVIDAMVGMSRPALSSTGERGKEAVVPEHGRMPINHSTEER